MQTTFGDLTGISFIDSTSTEVCHPNRAHSHKVLKDPSGWGEITFVFTICLTAHQYT
ncbi:MAG: hypothetical protein DCF15_08145, partial [Phormidesmis priestleyi]